MGAKTPADTAGRTEETDFHEETPVMRLGCQWTASGRLREAVDEGGERRAAIVEHRAVDDPLAAALADHQLRHAADAECCHFGLACGKAAVRRAAKSLVVPDAPGQSLCRQRMAGGIGNAGRDLGVDFGTRGVAAVDIAHALRRVQVAGFQSGSVSPRATSPRLSASELTTPSGTRRTFR